MINLSTVTTALYDALVANAGLSDTTIERSTRINFDPARAATGWIGVYPGTLTSTPRAMGGRQWQDEGALQVVVQTASFGSDGTTASDLLEALVGEVIDAINADLTLGLTGCRVVGFEREYRYVIFDDDGSGDLFMPQAVIKVKIETRSN